MKSVEIINNSDGTYSVRVYDIIIFTGSLTECERRADRE